MSRVYAKAVAEFKGTYAKSISPKLTSCAYTYMCALYSDMAKTEKGKGEKVSESGTSRTRRTRPRARSLARRPFLFTLSLLKQVNRKKVEVDRIINQM